MKIYVSAKFDDKERVKKVYDLLQQAGHTITHEWIHNKAAFPFSEHKEFTARCATEDIQGVLDADVFILLSNAQPSMGSSAELGAALASCITFKKPSIFVVGPHFDTNFAFYHPTVTLVESVEQVLQAINIFMLDKKIQMQLQQ